MDQEEAEHLARAIRKAPVDWIQIQGVEFNAAVGAYEVKCAYRQAQRGLSTTRKAGRRSGSKARGDGLIS